jgi:hypothetical protein
MTCAQKDRSHSNGRGGIGGGWFFALGEAKMSPR